MQKSTAIIYLIALLACAGVAVFFASRLLRAQPQIPEQNTTPVLQSETSSQATPAVNAVATTSNGTVSAIDNPTNSADETVKKWGPAFATISCTYGAQVKTPGTGQFGSGIVYSNPDRTKALVVTHSKSTVSLEWGSQPVGADYCDVYLDGASFRIENKDMQIVGPTNGGEAVALLVVTDARIRTSKLPVTSDLCTYFSYSDPVIVLGYENGYLVEGKSTIVGRDADDHLTLGPTVPHIWNSGAVIDAKNNCYLGVPSKDSSFVMPPFTLGVRI